MIRFLQSEWLWLLALLPLALFWRGRQGAVAAVEYSNVSLARKVARDPRSRAGGWVWLLPIIAGGLLVVGLARPQFGRGGATVQASGIDRRKRETSGAVAFCLNEMDAASATDDPVRFFQAARAALQQQLAAHWHWQVAPASITMADIDERLDGKGAAIHELFALADQAVYSGQRLTTADFKHWRQVVREQLQRLEEL
jgi:hypothetical protein